MLFSASQNVLKKFTIILCTIWTHILLELLETIFDLKVEDEPSEDFYDDIDLDLLIDAVRKLDDKLKSVIAYKVYYDLTADEIAQIMGISKRTVFNYLNKAKRQILDLIGGDRFE